MKILGRCLMLFAVVIAILLAFRPAQAAMYLNSSEPQCNGSDPTVVFCDDFEDGSYVFTQDNEDDPANDGWRADIFYPPGSFPDPQGTGFGRCGGKGAVGTNCTATSGPRDPTRTGQGPAQAEHGFGPNRTQYPEIHIRYYYQPQSNHLYTSNFKQTTINDAYAHGSIKFNNIGAFRSDGKSQMAISANYEQGLYPNPTRYQNRNCPPGGTTTRNPANYYPGAGNPICVNPYLVYGQNPAHWYYVELHLKMNSPGVANGVLEMWLDDCGSNGLGCTGAGTLRTQYTDLQFKSPSDPANFGIVWFENWSNPGTPGEEYYDQVVVATRRIGPMGVSIPNSPQNLRIQ